MLSMWSQFVTAWRNRKFFQSDSLKFIMGNRPLLQVLIYIEQFK